MAIESAPEADTKGKRQNLRYAYRDRTGAIQEQFTTDSRSVAATVLGNGETIEANVADLFDEADRALVEQVAEKAPMLVMAAIFGLKTTIGNAATSVKNGDADDIAKALQTRRDTIVEDGEWRGDTVGGPRTAHIIEAISNIVKRASGQELNDAGKAALKQEIITRGAKAFTSDAAIAAELAAMDMARAQAKLAKMQAAAATAAPGGILASLGINSA